MNSSSQNFSTLAIRAFEECSSKAELNYVAKTLGDVYESRRDKIKELLDEFVKQSARTSKPVAPAAGNPDLSA